MHSVIFLILAAGALKEIAGHGMMLEPPNRSSLWRFDSTAPKNYEDNQNFCGGAYVQNGQNGGRCGVCGDNYKAPHPQDNENTGKYGQGKVVRTYTSGSVIEVGILLTANHMGTFNYSLCPLLDPTAPEPGEHCFMDLMLEDGTFHYHVSKDDVEVTNRILLPQIKCERCVLRWTYRAGNNWGKCEDGTSAVGCGPQEHFRSCADIAIEYPYVDEKLA